MVKTYSEQDIKNMAQGSVAINPYTRRNVKNKIDDLIEYAEGLKYKISVGLSLAKATQRSQALESIARGISEELNNQVLAELEKGDES